MLLPKLRREANPFVGVRGWHADVGEHDVRRGALDRRPQLVEVTRQLDELDVVDVGEDAGDALAGEEAVFGDDNANRHRPL
jgi:hypothetical protein